MPVALAAGCTALWDHNFDRKRLMHNLLSSCTQDICATRACSHAPSEACNAETSGKVVVLTVVFSWHWPMVGLLMATSADVRCDDSCWRVFKSTTNIFIIRSTTGSPIQDQFCVGLQVTTAVPG